MPPAAGFCAVTSLNSLLIVLHPLWSVRSNLCIPFILEKHSGQHTGQAPHISHSSSRLYNSCQVLGELYCLMGNQQALPDLALGRCQQVAHYS